MLLEAKNITFKYPNAQKNALEEVSLSIDRGGFVTLCGLSGCGKSTLLRLLKPLIAPRGDFSGEILLCGENAALIPERTAAAQIGFVPQDPESAVVTDRVWHEIAFGLESIGTPRGKMRRLVAECAEYFGLGRIFESETASLSGGEKQLVALAAAMALRPKLLLLDEPTSQLDPISVRRFIDMLARLNRELGTAVIIAEHRLEELFAISDSIAVLDGGKLYAQSSPREIYSHLKNHPMEKALPAAVKLYSLGGGDGKSPITVREGAENSVCQAALPLLPQAERRTRKEGEKPVLAAREVWVSYGKGADALKSASLSLMRGEVYALIGGNGSGKTTLLKTLAGIIKPLGGKVKPQKGARIAYLPQNPMEILSGENALCVLTERGVDKARAQALLREIGFSDEQFMRDPADLSGGERQRLALCALLSGRPDVLLLDEPSKGMDAAAKAHFAQKLRTLAQSGVSVLLVTHDAEFAESCADICGLLFNGEITSEGAADDFFAYTTPLSRLKRLISERDFRREDK